MEIQQHKGWEIIYFTVINKSIFTLIDLKFGKGGKGIGKEEHELRNILSK
jgi:hypothetical protein